MKVFSETWMDFSDFSASFIYLAENFDAERKFTVKEYDKAVVTAYRIFEEVGNKLLTVGYENDGIELVEEYFDFGEVLAKELNLLYEHQKAGAVYGKLRLIHEKFSLLPSDNKAEFYRAKESESYAKEQAFMSNKRTGCLLITIVIFVVYLIFS